MNGKKRQREQYSTTRCGFIITGRALPKHRHARQLALILVNY
jgi:hypothetical protein